MTCPRIRAPALRARNIWTGGLVDGIRYAKSKTRGQIKMKLSKRTLFASIPFMLLPVAHAQNADLESSAAEMDEVLVTGSRLATTGLKPPRRSPFSIARRSRPPAPPASANCCANCRSLPLPRATPPAAATRGSATVALRGLSAVNTLVLINGRRVLSNNDGGTVDLNSIPFEAVERVEVLQDGASAIYGSDAIAGVVNIIMRREFDGLTLKGGYGVSSRGDLANTRAQRDVWPRRRQGRLRLQRLLAGSRRQLHRRSADQPRSGLARAGRTQFPRSAAHGGGGARPARFRQRTSAYCCEGVNQAATVNDFRAFVFPDTDDPLSVGNDGINYWLYETSASDIRQQNVSFTGDYEISSSLTAFVEASFNRRQSTGYLAPDYFGAVYGDPIILSANNDFNPFGVDLCVARTIGEQPFRGRRQSQCHFRCVAHRRRRRRRASASGSGTSRTTTRISISSRSAAKACCATACSRRPAIPTTAVQRATAACRSTCSAGRARSRRRCSTSSPPTRTPR